MLKNVYDKKSEIPTGAESFYSEKDGKFELQVTGFKSEEDVKKLQDVVAKERTEKRDALSEVKSLKSKYGALPEDFDINQYNSLMDADPAKDLDVKLKEQRDRMTKQFDVEKVDLLKQVDTSNNLVSKHVKDAQLLTAMSDVGVPKHHIRAVTSMFRNEIVVEGENVLLNERPIGEAIKSWSETDEGKHYVEAKENSGGNSNKADPNMKPSPENKTSVQKIASGLKDF